LDLVLTRPTETSNTNQASSKYGSSPKFGQVSETFNLAVLTDDVDLFAILLQKGVDISPQIENSVLYRFATIGDCYNTAMLLDAGALLKIKGGPCGTALMGACNVGNLSNVRVLVRRGALLTYEEDTGAFVSGIMQAKNHPEVVHWLLVSRFIEQQKLSQGPHMSTEATGLKAWAGLQCVELSVPRAYGVSQLDYLRKLNEVRKGYAGTVFHPID
jgi:hypothetical protein